MTKAKMSSEDMKTQSKYRESIKVWPKQSVTSVFSCDTKAKNMSLKLIKSKTM